MSDSFLSSMTFASQAHTRQCDCDECGGLVEIPAPIMAAMQRKRQKMTLRRTQERSLVYREEGIAVWELVMPVDAEPLVEFGSSHRLVWLQSMNSENQLRSIGTGIIGSSDEEKSRKDLDWKEGGMYLVPSNGGKAMGWVHAQKTKESSDESKDEDKPSGHAVMQVVKVPADNLLSMDGDDGDVEEDEAVSNSCVSVFLRFCLKGFIEIADSGDEKPPYYRFPEEDCSELKKAFLQAKEKSGNSVSAISTNGLASIPLPKTNEFPIPEPRIPNGKAK